VEVGVLLRYRELGWLVQIVAIVIWKGQRTFTHARGWMIHVASPHSTPTLDMDFEFSERFRWRPIARYLETLW
jgi:hypothetical protein